MTTFTTQVSEELLKVRAMDDAQQADERLADLAYDLQNAMLLVRAEKKRRVATGTPVTNEDAWLEEFFSLIF